MARRRAPRPAAPRGAGILRAAVLIAAAPALCLLLLVVADALDPLPALAALAVCAAAAGALAQVWIGDLARLAQALRAAAVEDAPLPLPLPERRALLPAVDEIAEGVGRLARRLAERSELVGRLRRADEAIVECLPDPLLVLSPERQPLRANAAARALFGAGRDGPGARGGDVAALLRHPALAAALDRALAEQRAQAADLVLPVPVTRELAAQVIPLSPPLADGGRIVVVLSDRTRERAVERMRADFVANASHELRTPLASLIGFIETLRGPAEDDPAARTRFLGIMAEQSERMRRLIDDLLGLSRVEISEHQPPVGEVALARLVQTEADALEPLLRAHSLRLALDLDLDAVAAPADAEQLAQVVRNLIENAIRHGRPAGGQVRVAVAPWAGTATTGSPASGGQALAPIGPGVFAAVGNAFAQGPARLPARPGVVLLVADDGPGIPRAHLPRLTERFYRVERSRGRGPGSMAARFGPQFAGTGLGLAIVKHVVNRHRGQLLIESEEGVGTTLRVWLPGPGPGAGIAG